MFVQKFDITKEFLNKEYVENKKSTIQISKEIGCSSTHIGRKLKEFGIQPRKTRETIDFTNKRFCRLVALRPISKDESGTVFCWECKCDCGKTVIVRRCNLASGHTKSCGCLARELSSKRVGKSSNNWKGCGQIPGNFIYKFKSQAKRRKIPFDITNEYLNELLEKQQYKCAITGDLLFFDKQETNASIDRIDSTIGYLPENIQWVTKTINIMKNNLSTENFIKECLKVIKGLEYAKKT